MNRNTIQRELVFEAVAALKNHPTPEDVYNFIVKAHPNISRSTVYRNLSLLCENERLLKVPIPDGADHVDHNIHPHYHIVCKNCGRVADVDLPYIPDLPERIINLQGFEISGYNLVFNGLCPNCKINFEKR